MAASTVRPRGKQISKFFSAWRHIDYQGIRKNIVIILTNPDYSWFIGLLLLIVEVVVTSVVILKIPYTEIDWKAYMQEVEGFINGTLDYKLLKGDTGPLVYPAGFVYVYTILYYITEKGTNIILAQWIFSLLYLATLYVVFRLYVRSTIVPPYALIFMCCTSYRIHSIFVLRLFNDPVAIFFFFCALNFFCDEKWLTGSIFYSFAVSIKMNILLFAPGLLFILLYSVGVYNAISCIAVCAIVQVLVGLPFLISNPISYITCAFDLGRVFLHEWTVNWRFVPEDVFVSKSFHISLLFLHLVILALFTYIWVKNYGFGASSSTKEFDILNIDNILFIMFSSNLIGVAFSRSLHYQFYVWYFFTLPHLLWSTNYNPVFNLFIMFSSNLIGVAFSRSLHYQFYVWYFFTLPHLLWSTNYNPVFKLCILGCLELCWNTYPSTVMSSSVIHLCHCLILFNLSCRGLYAIRRKAEKAERLKE